MKKTLSAIIAKNRIGPPNIYCRLKGVNKNHSPDSVDGLVEQYILKGDIDSQLAGCFDDLESLMENLKTPHAEFWCEFESEGVRFGHFVRNHHQIISLECFIEVGGKCALAANIRIDLDKFRNNDRDGNFAQITSSKFLVSLAHQMTGRTESGEKCDAGEILKELHRRMITRFALLMAAICCPRVATTERLAIGGMSERRRMQRGFPVNSVNVVRCKTPPTSIQRGVVKGATCCVGVRKHIRRGHWRLYEWPKDQEPYFEWIEETEVGDEELGVIVKQKYVEVSMTSVRRGFVLPGRHGAPGEKVKAERLQ